MPPIIRVKQLTKHYKVSKKDPGLFGSIKSLLNREYKTLEAVKGIDITVEEGELVGFIGPNGAGKTTTLKMLSGLLYPTSGTATVLNYTPWERKKEFLKQFSLIMGQKAQLWWDLPLHDSLLLQKDIYEVEDNAFEQSLAELTQLLDLQEFLKIQVRKLSLGQRMRGELAAALIYRPKILFLDEPTIGLDVVVQKRIREFIAEYQTRHKATIILTSHYLEDVKQLAKRVVVIDHGQIMFDGPTENLMKKHADYKRIVLTLTKPIPQKELARFGKIAEQKEQVVTFHVPRQETTSLAAQMLKSLPVEDISIDEPSLENVVREMFATSKYA